MAKIQDTTLHLNTLIVKMKRRFSAERDYYTKNNLCSVFTSKWVLHFPTFISHKHLIFQQVLLREWIHSNGHVMLHYLKNKPINLSFSTLSLALSFSSSLCHSSILLKILTVTLCTFIVCLFVFKIISVYIHIYVYFYVLLWLSLYGNLKKEKKKKAGWKGRKDK